MNLEQLEDRLTPDKNDLDRELMEHPKLYWLAGEGLAAAVRKRELSKEEAKRALARVQAKLRKEDPKISVAASLAKAELAVSYKKARTAYKLDAEEADRWEAMKDAYRSRGFSLTSLGDLYTADYFVRDSVSERKPTTNRRKRK